MTRLFRTSAAIFSLSLAISTSALAGEVGGTFTTCTALSTAPSTRTIGSGLLTITVAAGDTVSWSGTTSAQITAGTSTLSTVTSPGSFNVPAGVTTYKILLSSVPRANTPRSPAAEVANSISVSCSLASSDGVSSSAGSIGAESQSEVTSSGIGRNADQRFGNGGNTVSSNGVFVSTQGRPGSALERPDWNAWINAEAHGFSGGLAGSSVDVVAGVDRLITGDFLVGVLVGYGKIGLTDTTAATSASAISPEIGGYFSSRANGLTFNGFLTAAQPTISTDGVSFSSTRYVADLRIDGRLKNTANDVRPFLSVRAFSEAQPAYVGLSGAVVANNISSLTVSAGLAVNFDTPLGTSRLKPSVGIAVEYKSRTSTLKGSDSFVYPRISFGLDGPIGRGNLSLHFDAGKFRSDTFDYGVSAHYALKF